MSLKIYATQSRGYTLTPEGSHIARCFRVIDLGTQDTEYQGNRTERPQVLLQWVLLDDETGKPVITRRYNASLHPQSVLRKDLEAWVGKINTAFSLASLLNKPCLLAISYNRMDNYIKTNVAGVSSVPQNLEVPPLPAKYTPLFFDLSSPDRAIFETLPFRMREDILKSKEVRTNRELYNFLTAPKKTGDGSKPKPSLFNSLLQRLVGGN
jgi:hypothetical protein